MSAVLSSDLCRRKKEIVFVEGYFIDCANELTGAVDATQDVIHIYGDDDPILDTTVNNSTLTLAVYDKSSNNALLDVLQQDDPNDTSSKQYNWNNVTQATVWANRINSANTQYTRSVIYKNWIPVPALPTGDASARGTRSFAGNAEVAKEFTQPIVGQKIRLSSGASGYTGTIAYAPVQVPDENVYALRVVAIEEKRTGTHIDTFNTEELTITASMVTAAKAVVIPQTSLVGELVNKGPQYAYVNYLYDKSLGVYPTLTGSGMFTTNC